MEHTKAYTLKYEGKSLWFDCHRRFLLDNHEFRKKKKYLKKGVIEEKNYCEWFDPFHKGTKIHPKYFDLFIIAHNVKWICYSLIHQLILRKWDGAMQSRQIPRVTSSQIQIFNMRKMRKLFTIENNFQFKAKVRFVDILWNAHLRFTQT